VILSIRGSVTRSSETPRSAVTTLKTPGGMPTASAGDRADHADRPAGEEAELAPAVGVFSFSQAKVSARPA
jgi:hypothetical protein